MKVSVALWREAAWADELDFVGPRVRTAPWAWALLLGGLLAAGWVWPQIAQLDTALSEEQQVLKRLQRAEHQAQLAVKAVRSPTGQHTAAYRLTPEAARHAAQLAQGLAYPWMDVLTQVESVAQAEQAVLLSFSLDLAPLAAQAQAQPEIHLSAAVKDDDAALRWAHAQGPSAQLLNRERLGASFVTAAGSYEWRAEASWSGGQP